MPSRYAAAAVSLTMVAGGFVPGVMITASATADVRPTAPTGSDFNGDGVGDLAIGVPYEDLRSLADTGAVNVIYGTATNGLTAAGDQIWTENSAGILGESETGDRFGLSLAAGDFDGDGYADLAVGSPNEDARAGVVHVLYGSPSGLTSAGNQLWSQDTPGMPETAAANDQFGWSLTADDFDGDGFVDLAVGVPAEDLSVADAGAVHVIYGSANGLALAGTQLWHQDTAGVEDTAELGDLFGSSLAAGDLDGDGSADLAIGVPTEDVDQSSTVLDAGAVNVIYGSVAGLDVTDDQIWSQATAGILGAVQQSDQLGTSLAAGDFSGDGTADLAIGVPYEDAPNQPDAGAVNVIYGSSGGLATPGNQLWNQGSSGILGTSVEDDVWGFALVAADFGKNSQADLAIGAPGELGERGSVAVIYGGRGGLQSPGNQLWTQDSTGILGVSESDDLFGRRLTAGDLGRTPYAELVIGIPGDTAGTVDNAGAVGVIYGSSTGATSAGNQLWSQFSPGIEGTSAVGERFGDSVAAR